MQTLHSLASMRTNNLTCFSELIRIKKYKKQLKLLLIFVKTDLSVIYFAVQYFNDSD